jgi:ketosteroid isomerase-like protein
MSDRSLIEAFVHQSYGRRRAGDVEGIMADFGADPVFRLAGDEILGALTSEIRGREALRQMVQSLVELWDWSEHGVDTILIEGNRVVVHGKGVVRFLPTGERFTTETLDLLTLVDGKIGEFVEFCDTHTVAKAMNSVAA